MLASTTASVHSPLTRCSLASSSSRRAFPFSVLFVKPQFRFRFRQERLFLPLSFVFGGGGGGGRERRCAMLGFYRCSGFARDSERGLHYDWSGFVRRCRDFDGEEADFALEANILEFMKSSDKPHAFPSRKELADAGRMDLAEAIVKHGGWLTMGWDSEEVEGGGGGGQEDQDLDLGSSTAIGYNDLQRNSDLTGEEEEEAVSSCPYDNSSSASSSGRSLEMKNTSAEHETGIEGILSRLEKERSFTFGLGVAENEDRTLSASNIGKDKRHTKFSAVGGSFGSSRSSSLSSKKAIFDESGDRFNQNKSSSDVEGLISSHELESWRAWSLQRAGFSDFDPEVIEISSGKTTKDESVDIPEDEKLRRAVDILEDEKLRRASDSDPLESNESGLPHELIDLYQLRSRLQRLDLELSSVLQAVRSNADENASEQDHESSSDDLQKLSDAWEFQENEIMNAKDKLRSIRAKLAVLEGKTSLAIIDAQKIIEEKQTRIDNAHRALRLLRPTCIIWPNSASEVLLAGSFDGWATQRKMEKSNTGVFSLWLQLYPGRYEIKFIVDGEWKIDPLRPIVMNNGHQNNLLIVT